MKNIGRYEILGELGRGGMGVVFHARDPLLKREVAIKRLLPSAAPKGKAAARLKIEAQAVARLRHPGITKLHEVLLDGESLALVMGFVDGGSLHDTLQQGPLEPHRAAALTEQMANALQHAHDQRILHRDLKPANILLTKDGRALLTDFGLARDLSEERERLTLSGQLVGTPVYMSPEQTHGKKGDIDERSDVYSLGATLYEMLTGEPPFNSDSLLELISAIHGMEPALPSSLRNGIDPDLEAICLKCLKKEPAARYASAKDLAEDLRRYIDGGTVSARRPSRGDQVERWTGRNQGLVVSLAVATPLLFLAVGVAFGPSARGAWDGAQTDQRLTEAAKAKRLAEAAKAKRLAEAESLASEKHRRAEEHALTKQRARASDLFASGRRAYRARAYAKAALWYRKAADAGNVRAMRYLGDLYWAGEGVRQDPPEAARWFRKAADAGDVGAMLNLASLNWAGEAMKRDLPEGARWFRKAAEAGNEGAMLIIGNLYWTGEGVNLDFVEAALWFRKAAAAGNPDGMNNLGYLYDNGEGVKQDFAEAARWFRKAAAAGNSDAMNNLGSLYDKSGGLTQDFLEAARWYRKAADAGNSGAMFNLGTLYHAGLGVKLDKAEAASWYRKAAAAGYSPDRRGLSGFR